MEPEEDWEDNPPYFDAIDIKILRERINEKVLKQDILNQYQEAVSHYLTRTLQYLQPAVVVPHHAHCTPPRITVPRASKFHHIAR